MSSPPPPGIYQIRNAETGHFLLEFTRIGDAVHTSGAVTPGPQQPGQFVLSKGDNGEYRLSLLKFGGPDVAVGIENGEKLLWVPGRGDAWNIRGLIGPMPPVYEIFIAEDSKRHWVEDTETHEINTLEEGRNAVWQFIAANE